MIEQSLAPIVLNVPSVVALAIVRLTGVASGYTL
jgi:hypothetical protein